MNINEITVNEKLINDKDLLESYFLDCQCALFLVDITSEKSFDLIKELLEQLNLIFQKNDNSQHLRKIIIFNKIDLESKRKISQDKIDNFINKDLTIDSIEASLKTLKGIKELISLLLISYEKIRDYQIPTDYIYEGVQIIENKEIKNSDATINLILIGESEVGKSCFFTRYYENKFSENFITTVGIDKGIKIIKIKDTIYKLNLWDTAGQERFRSLPERYFQNADGVLLLFDISNKNSFENVDIWVESIKKSVKSSTSKNVFLIGNKIDLERVIKKEEAIKKADDYGFKYFEASCKINMNLTEIMARMIYSCYKSLDKNQNLSLDKYNKKKKKKSFVEEYYYKIY